MPETLSLIEGAYFEDLLDQPRAVRATLANLASHPVPAELIERLRRPGSRVVLTGMGSSLHALHPLHLRWVGLGTAGVMVETSELLHSQPALLAHAEVVLAVSQSGASAEIFHLLGVLPPRARLVGVTNTADSPLARTARDVILTQAGGEATVACKTYVATLAALAWLGSAVERGAAGAEAAIRDLGGAADALEAYLGDLRERVRSVAMSLEGVRQIFVTGRGASLAAAGGGALINKEAARTPVEGMSSAAFRHGPLEMCSPETLVLVLEGTGAGAELNRRLVEDVLRAGGRAELVGMGAPDGPWQLPPFTERGLPLGEILPLQVLSLALAARAGREAGRFEHATKVTVVE